MSIATIAELQSRLSDSELVLTEASAGLLLAAATGAIESYCNSYFGRRPSRVSPGGSSTVFTVPGHGLVTGDYVMLSGMDDSTIDGLHQVTVLTNEVGAFSIADLSTSAEATGLIRKRRTKVCDTRGGDTIYLNPCPVSEVTRVRLADSPNVFSSSGEMDSADYMLELNSDGVCITGGLVRLDAPWPYSVTPRRFTRTLELARGAVEVQYVSGALVVPGDIVDAAIQLAAAIAVRGGDVPVASESLEYYSFSMLTGEALKSLPDSALAAMSRHKRHAI